VWINVISLAVLLTAPAPAPAADPLRWEAEDLGDRATIAGGGDLLLIRTPDPKWLPLSGGRAMTFAPVGKGASLQLRIPVARAGVYRLRVRGVVGPSCGIYALHVNGRACADWNFHADATRHTNQTPNMSYGLQSKRMVLKAGDNVFRFEYQGKPGRMGALVLDTLQLQPEVRRPKQYTYDPYDKRLPPGERLGPNLVVNGDFEAFTPHDVFLKQHQGVRHWRFNSVVPKDQPTIVRDAARAHAGKRAILLDPDLLEDNAVVYQSIATHSGRTYRVSFWARGEGAFLVLFYQRPPAKTEDTSRGMNTFKAGEDWRFYSFLFSPSRSAKASSAAIALYAERDSTVTFDDISVQEVLK